MMKWLLFFLIASCSHISAYTQHTSVVLRHDSLWVNDAYIQDIVSKETLDSLFGERSRSGYLFMTEHAIVPELIDNRVKYHAFLYKKSGLWYYRDTRQPGFFFSIVFQREPGDRTWPKDSAYIFHGNFLAGKQSLNKSVMFDEVIASPSWKVLKKGSLSGKGSKDTYAVCMFGQSILVMRFSARNGTLKTIEIIR
jgi:hypothetical protein